jgi:hypothetical protein
MSNVITASGISIGCHPKGLMLSVIEGSMVVANIRLSDDLARRLDSELRRAREAQHKHTLKQQTRIGEE